MPKVSASFDTYRDILKRAFQITRHNKFLWLFGFFAAFLGVGGELESLFRNYTDLSQRSNDVFSLQTLYEGGIIWGIVTNAQWFFSNYPWQSFFFLLMIVVLAIVLLWLAIVSQIALFDSAYKLDKKKKVTYSDGYRVGNKYFGSVLLVNILLKVVLYGLLIVVGAPLITWFLVKGSTWGGVLFVLLIFFVFVPVSAIISFIVKYAVAYIVIKDKDVTQSIKNGWNLFRENWLVTLEMAVIILVIGVLVGLGILLAIGIAAIPFIVVSIAALLLGAGNAFAAATVVGVIVWFIIVAIAGAIYVAFQYTAWALLFTRLVEGKAQSKLMRWFGKSETAAG